jgi:integrase
VGVEWEARKYEASRRVVPTAGLTPITLQESRHTAATWLDAAGVPPKIASVRMGHATPQRQPGAAHITLARYTHALPEDIEDAREKLAAYLAKYQEAQ